MQEGDPVRADKMFHLALKMSQDLGHIEAETHVLCLLANLALERGLVGQAERLFTSVLQRILAGGEQKDSNAVVEISLKLANIFATNNNFEKAEQGFMFCAASQREKLRAADKAGLPLDQDSLGLLGLVLDQQAQFLLARDRLGTAEVTWREAVEVAIRLHGEEGEQTLVVQNSLASLMSMRGENKSASQLLQQVVDLADPDSAHLPTFLVNLGLVSLKQGLVERAGQLCGEARRLAGEKGDEEAGREAHRCLEEVSGMGVGSS